MKTIYTPIAVSSGELPPLNTDFIGIDIKGEVDNYFFSSYVNFEKYFIKEWLKKEEVPEVGDNTRYGIIEEFVEKDGVKMMRSNNPYGTWPIEPC